MNNLLAIRLFSSCHLGVTSKNGKKAECHRLHSFSQTLQVKGPPSVEMPTAIGVNKASDLFLRQGRSRTGRCKLVLNRWYPRRVAGPGTRAVLIATSTTGASGKKGHPQLKSCPSAYSVNPQSHTSKRPAFQHRKPQFIAASSTVMSPSISHDKPRRAMRHRWFHSHKGIPVHAVVAHSPRIRSESTTSASELEDDDSNNASDSVADWLTRTLSQRPCLTPATPPHMLGYCWSILSRFLPLV